MDKRKFESQRDTVFLCIACFMVIIFAGVIGVLIGNGTIGGNTTTQTQTQTMVINQAPEAYKPDINTCSKSDLMALPGIGNELACRIITYRTKTKIESINQLNEIRGIGDEIIKQLDGRVTFD